MKINYKCGFCDKNITIQVNTDKECVTMLCKNCGCTVIKYSGIITFIGEKEYVKAV